MYLRRPRGSTVLMLSALAMALAVATIAWACTPQALITITLNGNASGRVAASDIVTVTGTSFVPNGPVEIYWGEIGGLRLDDGTLRGAHFVTEVTVPDAAPGPYTIVAVGRYGSDSPYAGKIAGSYPDTVEIRNPAAATIVSELPAIAPEAEAAAAVEPISPAASEEPAPQPAAGPVQAVPAPSKQSAAADLWSGFDSSRPSLTGPSLSDPSARTDAAPGLTAGIALLSLGLIGLSSSVVLAQLRRRRALAGRSSTDE